MGDAFCSICREPLGDEVPAAVVVEPIAGETQPAAAVPPEVNPFATLQTRNHYALSDLPDYLQPFQRYLRRESYLKRIVQVVLGLLIFPVGIFCFMVAMAAGDAVGRPKGEGMQGTLLLLSFAGAPVGWLLIGFGQRLLSRRAPLILRRNSRRPILYLRSFVSDSRWFENWSDLFWMVAAPGRTETAELSLSKAVRDIGPLIAIGKPGELLPPFGAARMYVDGQRWQQAVEQLVKESQMVVFRTGATTSFWWEMQHVFQNCDPQKVLVYLPPRAKNRFEMYNVLRDRARGIFPHSLPDHPGDAIFLGFGPGWAPRLYPARGPREISKLRQLIVGSPGPCIRDGINEALRQFGKPVRGMRLQFREWVLILIPLMMLLGFAILIATTLRHSSPSSGTEGDASTTAATGLSLPQLSMWWPHAVLLAMSIVVWIRYQYAYWGRMLSLTLAADVVLHILWTLIGQVALPAPVSGVVHAVQQSSQWLLYALQGLFITSAPILRDVSSAEPQPLPAGPIPAKRSPVLGPLALVLTLNLYGLFWLHRTIRELRQVAPDLIRTTPGAAVGLLLLPIVNIFWFAYLSITIPLAVSQLNERYPERQYPSSYGSVLMTMILLGAAVFAGLGVRDVAQYECLIAAQLLLVAAMAYTQRYLNRIWDRLYEIAQESSIVEAIVLP